MGYRDPKAITAAGIDTGTKKAGLRPDKALVGGFLAGAYIAFAGLLAITVSAGLDPARWGTLPTLFSGSVFALGLILVVLAGSELLTGNMALVPLAAMGGRIRFGAIVQNLGWVLIGNVVGSIFVAYFLAVQSGVVTAPLPLARLGQIATAKAHAETEWQIFLRALGCNWLVCLAVWMAMAADDVAGKILAIFFPIMAFVAMGFDHVVANMFFLPAAIFAHVGDVSWWDAIHNWIFAFLGNLVGAAVFVAGAYYYLYGRPGGDPGDTPAGYDADEAARAGARREAGRFARARGRRTTAG